MAVVVSAIKLLAYSKNTSSVQDFREGVHSGLSNQIVCIVVILSAARRRAFSSSADGGFEIKSSAPFSRAPMSFSRS